MQWGVFLQQAGVQDSVFDLCQLTCNLSYQLAGLRAHEKAGIPIKYIELGNEMYDSSRKDALAVYPQPSDYATAMLPWVTAIKKECKSTSNPHHSLISRDSLEILRVITGPNAQVALIGERWNNCEAPQQFE